MSISTHICPRCQNRSPVRLRPGQVCNGCEAARAWAQFGADGRVIVIGAEDRRAGASQVGKATTRRRAPKMIFIALILSLISITGALLLLYQFSVHRPELLPKQQIARFNLLSWWAILLSGLCTVMTGALLMFLWQKGWRRLSSSLMAGNLALLILSFVILSISFLLWGQTFNCAELPHISTQAKQALVQRAQLATTVIYALNKRENRYRPAVGNGVIIATQADTVWVLTVPFAARGAWHNLPGADALWVDFADGRSEVGRVLWFARPPLNLAIVEVNLPTPPALAEIHPVAEALVPGNKVMNLPNPLLSGWELREGTVLKRQSRREAYGLACLISTDMASYANDVGSGLYDSSGRLVGLKAGVDQNGTNSHYEMLPSGIISEIMNAARSGNLDRLVDFSSEVNVQ